MRVGLTRDMVLDAGQFLRPTYEQVVIEEKGRPLTSEELKQLAKECDTLIVQLTDKIDKDLLLSAPRLKHLITHSVGVDHIDVRAVETRGIRLSHTPDVLTQSTAELAWALVLSCARRLKPAAQWVTDSKFVSYDPQLFLGQEISGSTLGILGMGRIGEAVSKIGHAFGMRVIYSNRSPRNVAFAEAVSYSKLFEQADVISVHCPLTPETYHLVGELFFRRMKPRAVLVNTSRGPVMDEEALIRKLQKDPEFFAGLDVFEHEPQVPKVLRELPNCICLPHIGSATLQTREKMARICYDEAISFVKGLPLKYEYRGVGK